MGRMVITRAAPVNHSQFYHESMGIHTFTTNCFIHDYKFFRTPLNVPDDVTKLGDLDECEHNQDDVVKLLHRMFTFPQCLHTHTDSRIFFFFLSLKEVHND